MNYLTDDEKEVAVINKATSDKFIFHLWGIINACFEREAVQRTTGCVNHFKLREIPCSEPDGKQHHKVNNKECLPEKYCVAKAWYTVRVNILKKTGIIQWVQAQDSTHKQLLRAVIVLKKAVSSVWENASWCSMTRPSCRPEPLRLISCPETSQRKWGKQFAITVLPR